MVAWGRRGSSVQVGRVAPTLPWVALLSALAVGCAPRFTDAPPASASLRDTEGRGVILLTGARLREPAEVLAIVQVHLPHGAEDHGLEVLATEAAALGADAVVGVEYYRGAPGDTGHLSGLAVRSLP